MTLTQLNSISVCKLLMKVGTGREKSLAATCTRCKVTLALHVNHLLLGSSGESPDSKKEPALDHLYVCTINDGNPRIHIF